ncbi:hypothetical protein NDU88_007154 [Pleurodeles waltl]|uniref:Uncharacterized protein n=1 Tax=Pleurodeles waltl TaxID=8319 RepID=A0AAV7PPE4_PLEWA|nr:hypothetical protein NDU88_007154 [Pleurodeles waltl]
MAAGWNAYRGISLGAGKPSSMHTKRFYNFGDVLGGGVRAHGPLIDLLARVAARALSPRQRRRVNTLECN